MSNKPHRRRRRKADHLFGRNTEVRIADPPPAEVKPLLHEWVVSGWMRWYPPDALMIVAAGFDNLTAEPGEDAFDQLEEDRDIWGERPVHADDRQWWDRVRAAVQRLSAKLGIDFPLTLAGLRDLSEAAGLLRRDDHDRLVTQLPLPLVSELGILEPKDVAHEDHLRWMEQFEPYGQRIIRRFVDGSLDHLDTTLVQLAASLDCEVEDARQGVLVLLEEGDFTVEPDVGDLDPASTFILTVDWQEFDRSRITLAGS